MLELQANQRVERTVYRGITLCPDAGRRGFWPPPSWGGFAFLERTLFEKRIRTPSDAFFFRALPST